MPTERIHHTQQFTSGYETEGLNGEHLNHHQSIVHVLGNYAVTEAHSSPVKSFKIHSRELPKHLEEDRSRIVEDAFDARTTFAVTEPTDEVDFSHFIGNDGYVAHTD